MTDSGTPGRGALMQLPPINASVSSRPTTRGTALPEQLDAPVQPPRPRQTLMQRLNDKYMESLHDASLSTTRRLAAISAQNTKSTHMQKKQMNRDLAAAVMVGFAPPPTPYLQQQQQQQHEHMVHSSMDIVKLLAILDKHKQHTQTLQSTRAQSAGPATQVQPPLDEDLSAAAPSPPSPTPLQQQAPVSPPLHLRSASALGLESSFHLGVGLDPMRPGTSSSRPGTASRALTQLAFQDPRRASQIKADLEVDSEGQVVVSPARLTRRPSRPMTAHRASRPSTAERNGPASVPYGSSAGGVAARGEGEAAAGGGAQGQQAGAHWEAQGQSRPGSRVGGAGTARDDAVLGAARPRSLMAEPAGEGRQSMPTTAAGSRLGTPPQAQQQQSVGSAGLRAAAAAGVTGRAATAPAAPRSPSPAKPSSKPAKGEGKGKGKKGKRGKNGKGKKAPAAEREFAPPFMRISGPVTPFLPGMGNAWETPEKWELRTSMTVRAVQSSNPAGFDKRAAIAELSEHREAAERAQDVMSYVSHLPTDRIADDLLRVAMQELRFRRPFFHASAGPSRISRAASLAQPHQQPSEQQQPTANTSTAAGSSTADGPSPQETGAAAALPERTGSRRPSPSRQATSPRRVGLPGAPADSSFGGSRSLARRGSQAVWVWNAECGVFAGRLTDSDAKALHDTPAVLEQQLAVDWKHLLVREGFRRMVAAEDVTVRMEQNKVDKALESIRFALSEHKATLRSVFSYYACRSLQALGPTSPEALAAGEGPRRAVGRAQWKRLLEDMAVCTPGSRHSGPEACMAVFDAASEEAQQPPVSPSSSTAAAAAATAALRLDSRRVGNDVMLPRFAFYEALVRLAALKYTRMGPYDSLGDALDKLVNDNIKARVCAEALHDVGAYRAQRVYQQGVHAALAKHQPVLQALFDWGCAQTPDSGGSSVVPQQRMSLHGWLRTLELCGLTTLLKDHAGSPPFPHGDEAALIFCWSQMAVVGEAAAPQATFSLAWTDFLEAIARVADLASPPPPDEVEVMLRDVVQVPEEEMEAAMEHPWHAFFKQLPPEKAKVFRRPSAHLCAEKSQPLGDKVAAILDHVEPLLMEKLGVSMQADLAGSIRPHRRQSKPEADASPSDEHRSDTSNS